MRFLKVFEFATTLLNSCLARVSSFLASLPAKSLPPALTEEHLNAAKLCRDVYSSEVESSGDFVESKDTGVQAVVTCDDSRAIVCFRGSDTLDDWWHNFQINKVPFLSRKHSDPALEVHGGLFVGHNSIKDKVYTKLNAMAEAGECDRVLFTGHSAGAALAKLSAFDYVNEKRLPVSIISFGSPKVGNHAFAKGFNESMECTRIVNDNDGIALLPMLKGYHHVGDLIQLDDLALALSRDEGEGVRAGNWGRIFSLGGVDLVHDHDMNSYIATLEFWMKKRS